MIHMPRKVSNNRKKDRTRLKIILVLCLVIIAWMGLWTKAFMVQVMQGQELAAMADRQYFSEEKITGKRGEIFDRNKVVLAQSIKSKSVYANPFLVKDPDSAAAALADALEAKPSRMKKLLNQKSSFVWITRKISDRAAHRVATRDIPGIFIIEEHSRVYPRGHMLGQVLGFVGMDNQGLEGLEKSLNETLAGAQMVVVMQRDASGHKMSLLPQDPSAKVDGHDVVLTIDSEIQFAAEKSLASAVEKNNGKNGVSLVVHIPSGDILAWATYPFFNPNDYQNSNSSVWRNRGAVDLIEPGSTLKPFLMAAVLEEGIARSDSLYFCENGKWRLGSNKIKDVKEYGWLTLNRVLRYSSNICSAKIGLDLGPGPYFQYLDKLGFSTPTRLPLPGQGKGILRPPQTWRKMDLASISFGQGLASTPLQLARAYLSLANEGRFTELNIIRDEKRQAGFGPRIFSKDVSKEVMGMLRDAVEMDGTGTQARISGLEVGGKTGTAQKASPQGGYGKGYVASFVGFIPARDPEYLIMAIIDEPSPQHYGGLVAAPVFSEIGSSIVSSGRGLGLRNIPEKDPEMTQAGRPVENARFIVSQKPNKKVWGEQVPDLRGTPLRQAVEDLLSAGVVPVLKGRGVIVEGQVPAPGESWSKDGQKVVLHLGES